MRTLVAFAAVALALFLVGVAAAAVLAPRPEKDLYHRPPERTAGEPCIPRVPVASSLPPGRIVRVDLE